MIISNLTPSGDFTFGLGVGNYLQNDAAIALNIKTRILSWVGDCFFDQAAGIDWLNRLSGTSQATLLNIELRRIVLQSYGVTGIISLTSTLTGRVFSATINIKTINSPSYIISVQQETKA